MLKTGTKNREIKSKTGTSKINRKRVERVPFEPDYIIPIAPGEHLKEKLEEMGMSQEQFAKKAGLALEAVELLFLGRLPITQPLAEKLEKITKMPVDVWFAFEKQYHKKLKLAAKKYEL
jgi:HTH-type transcriptional regulator/antitoxin HigA